MYCLISVLLLLIFYFLSKKNKNYLKILIAIGSLQVLIYGIWRINVIPNEGMLSIVLGTILYLAEVLGLIQFFILVYLFSRNYKVEKYTLDEMEGKLPTVDILICIYNEPIEIVKKTLIAALNMDYPKGKFQVFICDDGSRREIHKLALKYGAKWITRDNNEGAKAGNINNALRYSTSDLFAVLDADMIPKKEFLKKTVGYFANEEVSFVQTPQVYYNKDMYQHNLGLKIPNEQDFFMRDVQEARSSINATLHVGTNAIFRRTMVDSIGGYPICSITEDMAVGMQLQAAGYKSVFINEELVYGLSADNYADLVKQRDRWCRGNLQVMYHFNPLKNKGLNIAQKIAYVDGIIYWLSSMQKMVYLLSPILFLLFGINSLDVANTKIFNMYIPLFLAQIMVFKVLTPGTRSLKWAHIYEVAMAPHISMSIIKQLLGLKIKFNVTPKNIEVSKGYFQFKVVMIHIILTLLNIMSGVVGGVLYFNNNIPFGAFLINIVWNFYNLAALLVCIKVAYQKPISDAQNRVVLKDKISAKITTEDGRCNCFVKELCNKKIILTEVCGMKFNRGQHIEVQLNHINIPAKVISLGKNLLEIEYESLKKEHMKYIVSLYTENMSTFYNVNKVPTYIKRKSKKIKVKAERENEQIAQ